MKITGAKVIVCCPGRNFVTLRIETDEGIVGWGDATLNGRELAVVSYLQDHVVPALLGRDASRIEDTWHFLYRGPYWRRGPVTMAALSAVDVALWDIKGKALGTPLYNLLGGKSREEVLVYGHANGRDIGEAVESVGKLADEGYRAIRVQCAVPGVPDTYGVPHAGARAGAYEPATKGLAVEQVWDTAKYLRFAPLLMDKVRSTYGDDYYLLHDVHHRCTPIEAARLARDLEPYRLFWLEDTVPAELQESLRLIRKHSVTPLAIGEVFNTIYDYTTLIAEQLIDFVRMPISHGGGITHLSKVAAMAAVYHVRTGFHGATDLSPVALGAAVHFAHAINNFGIQEYMPHQELVSEVFQGDYSLKNGALQIGERPGHGVEMDLEAAARFPYQPASLPVARLSDGTLFHW